MVAVAEISVRITTSAVMIGEWVAAATNVPLDITSVMRTGDTAGETNASVQTTAGRAADGSATTQQRPLQLLQMFQPAATGESRSHQRINALLHPRVRSAHPVLPPQNQRQSQHTRRHRLLRQNQQAPTSLPLRCRHQSRRPRPFHHLLLRHPSQLARTYLRLLHHQSRRLRRGLPLLHHHHHHQSRPALPKPAHHPPHQNQPAPLHHLLPQSQQALTSPVLPPRRQNRLRPCCRRRLP